MPAYAVIARIGRVDPHLATHDVDPKTDREPPPPAGGFPQDGAAAEIYVSEGPGLGRTGEWIVRLRERWAQATFYLFDAESWRT